MRDYIIALGTVMILITLAQMILPEGSIKKFASFAMGFIIISTITMPITNLMKDTKISSEEFSFEEDAAKAEASFRAEVIKKHRENITSLIEERMVHGSKAFVEVSENGEITKVTLRLKGDEKKAIEYIKNELLVKSERINLIYENN